MAVVSHISRLVQRGGRSIHFITAKDGVGRDCYFFIMPKETKEDRLKQLIEETDVNIEEIGHIVAAGFGTQPSEAVTQMLIKHYQVDPALITQAGGQPRNA